MFDPKIIVHPGVWGTGVAIVAVLAGTIKLVAVRLNGYQTKSMCNERSGDIKTDLKEIKADQKIMMKDIKDILKNGGG